MSTLAISLPQRGGAFYAQEWDTAGVSHGFLTYTDERGSALIDERSHRLRNLDVDGDFQAVFRCRPANR